MMKKAGCMYRKIGDVFWENVRSELEERDMTLAQFERAIELPKLYISTATNSGNLPRAVTIEKIAKFLDVDYFVLFIDEENDSYNA